PLLTENDLSSLDNLNQKFWSWLERDYHRKIHSSIGMTPLDKFMSQISEVKTCDNPEVLKEIFLKRDKRKVKHDGTLSVNKKLFEVPSSLINKQVEIRFDPEYDEEVFIYLEGQYICQAKPVVLSDNAQVKRNKSTISFSKMSKEGEKENV
ncbi:MAG: IS481 family transposase, partial [Candidatus Syntrophonatronum acetioxidans]